MSKQQVRREFLGCYVEKQLLCRIALPFIWSLRALVKCFQFHFWFLQVRECDMGHPSPWNQSSMSSYCLYLQVFHFTYEISWNLSLPWVRAESTSGTSEMSFQLIDESEWEWFRVDFWGFSIIFGATQFPWVLVGFLQTLIVWLLSLKIRLKNVRMDYFSVNDCSSLAKFWRNQWRLTTLI